MPEYRDPLPHLGRRLPPEFLRDLMTAPPIMSLKEAAPYLGLSESRARRLIANGRLAGVPGSRKGAKRCAVPRSAVIAYWEERYHEAATAQRVVDAR